MEIRPSQNSLSKLLRVTVVLLVVVLGASALLCQTRLATRLDFEGGNNGTEGCAVYSLLRVRAHETLYRDYAKPPYVVTQYMPLFYLAPGYGARLLQTDRAGTVLAGRVYTYLLWLGTGLLIFMLGRQAGCSLCCGALGSLLWLAGSLAAETAISFRPDAAVLFYSLTGLWVYQRSERLGGRLIALAFLVIAFLHKQSALSVVAVIVLDQLEQRRFRQTLLLAGGWVAAMAAILLIAQIMTAGAFRLNVLRSLGLLADPSRPLLVLELSLAQGMPVFLAGVLACVVVQGRQFRLLKRYFIVAALWAFFSSMKFGSGQNYYLEPFAVGCVLAAVILQDYEQKFVWLRLGWLGVALAAALLTLMTRIKELPQLLTELVHHEEFKRVGMQEWDQFAAILKGYGEPVFIEDVQLALRSGHVPYMMDASAFASMAANGLFDDTDLLRHIERSEFAAIVTMQPLESTRGFRHFPQQWIKPMLQRYVLAGNYTMKQTGQNYYLYIPAAASSKMAN